MMCNITYDKFFFNNDRFCIFGACYPFGNIDAISGKLHGKIEGQILLQTLSTMIQIVSLFYGPMFCGIYTF